MKKKLNLLIILGLISFIVRSQTATFITISSGGQFDRVTIGPSGCTTTSLNLCSNFTGSALSIALDSNILYIVDNKGFLYKNTLTATGTVGNCTKLGQFISKSTAIYGLTVGPGGVVYAASGSDIEIYKPTTNSFGVLGTLPNSWAIGGDMLFYQGKLYEAVKLTNGNNALIQVNLTNVSNSVLYMNFNAGTSVFGFASVTVPCSNNEAYALSTVGSSTDIYAVDMISKTQATTAACTLPFKVNDAASIAETQSATPPSNPVVTSPFNICKGDVINFPIPVVGSVKDTLKWYTQASGGSSYGTPTPKVDSSVLGTTTYYVSAFDTSTGCETPRQTMVVSVNPYPAVPIISPKDSVVICTGSNTTLTSSAATGNQWNLNGLALGGATNTTYTTGVAGNYTVTATTNKVCSKTSAITKVIVTDTIKSTTNLAICQSQIPYIWNGLTFNSAGTQTKTGLKTVSGCDSSATLILSVVDTVKSVNNKTICSRDLPYIWNGLIFNSAGTQTKYLKTVSGCDSAATLLLSVFTPTTLNKSFYNCKQVTYAGNIYTTSTTVKDTVFNVAGCDSIYNIVSIVITPITVLTNTTNLSDCKSILYQGNTYTTSTILRDTIFSIQGCDSIYNIANLIITPINPVINTINFSSCKSFTYHGNTYTSSTVLRDTLKSYQGCDSVYNVANIVITPVTPTTNATNFSNCKSITYKGNNYTTSTIVRDTVKSYQGCDSIYNVANIVIAPVTPTANTTNLYHCNKIIYNGYTYTSSTVVRDTVMSLNGGCDSVYNITNININSITPTNINLSFSDCKQVVYKGNTYYTSTVVRDTLKSYQGCDSVYTVATITIKSITPIINNKSFKHCKLVNYNGINYFSSTAIKDTLRSIGGCDSVYNNTTITISPITLTIVPNYYSGCDSVIFRGIAYYNSTIIADTIKSYQGCDSVFVQNTINIFPKPAVNFNSSIVYAIANTPIILKPVASNANSFVWYPNIYLDDTTVEYPVCTPLKDTSYKLIVYSDSGCKDSSYLSVIVSKPIQIPNVFSPNGDGVNDKWEIEFLNTYPQSTVQIFDRSGQLLYSSFAGSYKAWNGKYNGKDLPVGVYYYIIKLAAILPVQSGTITILR